ncbi:MAG: hypothetical protein ABIP48_01910 [Planctomycetota bacterium]
MMDGLYDDYWRRHLDKVIPLIESDEDFAQIDLPYERAFKGRKDTSFNMAVKCTRGFWRNQGARHLNVLAAAVMKYCKEGVVYRISSRINPDRTTFRKTITKSEDSGDFMTSLESSVAEHIKDHYEESESRRDTPSKDELFAKMDVLKPKIIELDRRRFVEGEEWRRGDLPELQRILFDNADNLSAETRFLAFWLCCVIDRQVSYETVWTEGLHRILEYMLHNGPIPQLRFDESRHILATMGSIDECGKSLSRWFINVIDSLAQTRQPGNLRRMTGRIARYLLGLTYIEVSHLDNGSPGLLGTWKRLWMFVMFVRRDQTRIRKLIEEVFIESGRRELIDIWYDDEVFSQTESELPVDGRVNGFFDGLGFSGDLEEIGRASHEWGGNNKLPPSVLDVVFVPGFNNELLEYGIEQGVELTKWWKTR